MVQDEKQTELCLRILQTCRAELCDLFPYLDAAFDCLRWRFGAETGFSVDGQAMYFPVRETLKCYSREPAALRRGYLHMLLHCLFLHLFKPAGEMWDIACDMAVEQMIERQAQPRLALENAVRKDCFDRMGSEPLPAERILELLEAGAFPYTMEEMRAAFSFDDHSRWDESAAGGLRSQWEQMLLDAAKNKAGKGKRGTTSGAATESPMETAESKYDYRKFLQRFTFPREEVELDTESFDYIFYNFGMEQYGSMPPDRAAGIQGSAAAGGAGHCHRHLRLLLTGSGKPLFKRDLCHSLPAGKLFPKDEGILYPVRLPDSGCGPDPEPGGLAGI